MPAYNKQDLDRRMHGALDVLKHDLAGLRTGRASTALLDPIQVEVYGANMPITQVATVSVPEPRTLSVQVLLVVSGHSSHSSFWTIVAVPRPARTSARFPG